MEYSFYSLDTGIFEPGCRHLPDHVDPASHAPSGHGVWPAKVDYSRMRVVHMPDDFGEGYPVLQAYQPPAPADDEWQTWDWDAAAWHWVSTPTAAAVMRDRIAVNRAERNRRMDEIIKPQLQAMRTGDGLAAINAYIAACLAVDLSAEHITWPELTP